MFAASKVTELSQSLCLVTQLLSVTQSRLDPFFEASYFKGKRFDDKYVAVKYEGCCCK